MQMKLLPGLVYDVCRLELKGISLTWFTIFGAYFNFSFFLSKCSYLKFILIVQLKHNLEQEVENMENEIVRLKAELEGETQVTDKEHVAEDNEDWPELSANTVKMLCEPLMLPHDATDRQSVREITSVMEDDGEWSANAQCDLEEKPTDTQPASSALRLADVSVDHGCGRSAVPLADVSGTELPVNRSCVQLASADAGDGESVSAVPDSLDEIPAAIDVADDGLEDDAYSYVSCEDIVIPDSEDDLFCSPHNGVVDCAVLMSCPDESKHANMTAKVSNVTSDVEQFDEVADCAEPVSMSEMTHASVDDGKEPCRRKVKRRIMSHVSESQCNQSNVCVSNADMMKHKLNVPAHCVAEECHLSGTDETIDAAFEMHQQLTSSSAIRQQLPKRPHYTFVVSGISQALDQVIFLQSRADTCCGV